MIPTEARHLMNLYMANARAAESEAVAEVNIAGLTAMIGYAAACGHITPAEHANEWMAIKLIREQRSNARRALKCA